MRLAIRGRTSGRAHQNPKDARGGRGGLRRPTTQARSPGRRFPEFSRTRRFPSVSRTRRRFNRPRGNRGATPTRRLSHTFGLRRWTAGRANGCRQPAKPPPRSTPTAMLRTVVPESPCGSTTTRCHRAGQTDRTPSHSRRFLTRKTQTSGHDTEKRTQWERTTANHDHPEGERGNVRVGSSQTGSGNLLALFEPAISRTDWGRVPRTTVCLERNSPRQCCPDTARWCSGPPRASTIPFRGSAWPPCCVGFSENPHVPGSRP